MNLKPIVERKLLDFLEEDLSIGSSFDFPEITVEAEIVSKDCGVVAGVSVLRILFDMVNVDVVNCIEDGRKIGYGDVVATIRGSAKNIFLIERTALNILMRMSGIATSVAKIVEKVKKINPNVTIAGTRKTTPGFRMFEKMAIKIGGGDPHRFSLGDCVLIKHSYVSLVGLEKAIEIGKKSSFTKKVEVEVECIEDAVEAAKMGVDMIMLDNMTPEEVDKVIEELKKRGLRDKVTVEVSGGINLNNVEKYAKTGVDVISTGYITHSSRWLDFSLKIRKTFGV